jgi:hypothetical protein
MLGGLFIGILCEYYPQYWGTEINQRINYVFRFLIFMIFGGWFSNYFIIDELKKEIIYDCPKEFNLAGHSAKAG